MDENNNVTEETDVVDVPRKVTVLEAKEGIMSTVKKHWKKIAVAGAAVGAVVLYKVFGSKKNDDYDDSEIETDFEEIDNDLDDVDSPEE